LDSVALHEARAELLAADAAWLEAAGDGDVDQIMAFWTEDAVIDPPGDVHAIVGGPAIRELITKRRKHRDYSITWRTRDAWVSADGSTGCTFRITTVVLPTDTGGTITLRSPFCCVWRKDGDVWKCILDLGLAEFEPDLLRPLPAGR
jgi:ketosteroid isomerase-like protein